MGVVILLHFTWLSGGVIIALYDIELSPKIELCNTHLARILKAAHMLKIKIEVSA